MPTLDQVSAGASAITQINANEQSMQVAAAYGRRASTSSGLTFGYYGATLQDGTIIAAGTVTVGASTTTYVVVDRATGAVSSATSTTNWNNTTSYMRMASLVSNASGITTYTDARPAGGLSSGGGGGGAVSSVNGQTGAVVLELGDLDDVDLSGLGDGDTLVYDLATTSWIPGTGGGGGATDFTDLGDVFSSYSGRAGLVPQVNAAETALITPAAPITKSAAFIFALSDLDGSEVQTTGATSFNATVPPNSSVAFPVGTILPLRRTGSGIITLVAGAGVTLNSDAGLVLGGGRSLVMLQKTATDTWEVKGELAGNTNCVIDRAYAEYATNADLTTTIPLDDTVPTSSEGTQIISQAFTAKSTTNRLRLRFRGEVTSATGPTNLVCAIFSGSTCLRANYLTITTAQYSFESVLEVETIPGSTSSVTYSVRIGPAAATPNAIRLNGNGSGRLLGGSAAATLVIEEIAA